MIRVSININENADLQYVEGLVGNLPAYLDKYLWQRLLEVAKAIASEAQTYAPMKTGLLKSKIFAVVEANGIAVTCEVDYAKFQEYGTKYILPKMFINSAMQNNYERISQTIVEVIQDYFRTVVA